MDSAFAYTVQTTKPFGVAVDSVESATAAKGFRVLHVHDVQATLAEKDFHREPFKIIEVCNARYASQALGAEVNVGLMLPCRITVYEQGGQVFISALRPTVLERFFPGKGLERLAAEVDEIITSVVDEAR